MDSAKSENITETTNGISNWVKNNKIVIGMVIILIVLIVACTIFKKETYVSDGKQINGWDVEKAVAKFMYEQDKVKKQIRNSKNQISDY